MGKNTDRDKGCFLWAHRLKKKIRELDSMSKKLPKPKHKEKNKKTKTKNSRISEHYCTTPSIQIIGIPEVGP